MASGGLTNTAYIYKRRYSDKQVIDMASRRHPTMAMMAKEGGFSGVTFHYAAQYGDPQGISGTFADAQTAAETLKGEQYAASRSLKFGIITLDGESMAAAEGSDGAFFDLVTRTTDGIINAMGNNLAFDLQRSGDGMRGRRSSASTNVITLSLQDDVRNFHVGMTVIASANADGSSARTGSTKVASVDKSSSTITLVSAAGITSFADNDYLFRLGDPGTCMDGMEDIYPLAAVTSGDSFRGVDRSVQVELLTGARIDDTATAIEENAGLVAVTISQNGQQADTLCLNPINYWQVVRRLNAKVEYDDGGGTANYGFEYFKVHTPAGTLKCYSDPDVPTNRGRVLQMKSNYIKTLKSFIHVISDDGRPNLRQTSADGIEARVRSMGNLVGNNTAANGVFSI